MLRFADDPDPRMRMLALRDPASTPDLVDRFTRDPASRVRAEAAADPRLSPESAVRLADASSTVCHQVAANPVAPTALLISLLRSATSAHAAGRNAAIPVPVMHRMLDAAAPHYEPAKPYPGFTPSPSPR